VHHGYCVLNGAGRALLVGDWGAVAVRLANLSGVAYVLSARHAGCWPRSPRGLTPISTNLGTAELQLYCALACQLGAHFTGDH